MRLLSPLQCFRIFCVGAVVLTILCADPPNSVAGKKSNKKSADADEVTPEEAALAEKTEKRARELLEPIFGKRLKEVDAVYPGHGTLRVSFIAISAGIGGLVATRTEMRDAYYALFTAGPESISEVDLRAYAPVMDGLGNVTIQIVYSTSMDRGVAGLVNWDNRRAVDFTKLWRTQIEDSRWQKQ